MHICKNIEQLREQLGIWRNRGESIGFVPTMGNLHAGHLSLVEIARQKARHVVVSIFVNPLQFSPHEDFDSYPRTLEQDLHKLEMAGVELVFTPDISTIYPAGKDNSSYVEVPGISSVLEGEFRPGFFKGVATVVLKLFNMVQPDYAVFGEKDYQQLLVVRKMVNDLNLPLEIIAGAIKREADGLAMSSRNNYLAADDREKSGLLFQVLRQCCLHIQQGMDIGQAEKESRELIENKGFNVDYLTLRRACDLAEAGHQDIVSNAELVVLVAATIAGTRLIDNIRFIPTEPV